MNRITTALLVSDDLDDHQTFTEAFGKIMPSLVVVAVLSQAKALELLASKRLVPDIVLLDLTAQDSDAIALLASLKTVEDGKPISFTMYGNDEDLLVNRIKGVPTFEKDCEFPQLVGFFEILLQKHMN